MSTDSKTADSLLALLAQMKEQQDDDRKVLIELMRKIGQSSIKQEPSEFLIESLSRNIVEFVYDPDRQSTFDVWFSRYEELFEKDAANLTDDTKVRLLLRKLNTQAHAKYVNYILPKKVNEFSFKETIVKLTKLFGLQKSLFSIRYNCLQNVKSDNDDYITYTGQVNKLCEDFQLSKMTLDQFKCLIFVIGLKSSTDIDIRTRLLSKIESQAATINLETISDECQSLINLKRDTAMIQENVSSSVMIQKIRKSHNFLKKPVNRIETKVPRTPCWNCGEMHFFKNCTYLDHMCNTCKTKGHKDGYCNTPKGKSFKFNKKKSIIKGRKFIQVEINGAALKLQYDTAADITIISKQVFNQLDVQLQPTNIEAKNASGDKLQLIGQFQCNVRFQDKNIKGICYVSKCDKLNVFGADFIEQFDMWDIPISKICNVLQVDETPTNETQPKQTQRDYIEVFEKWFPSIFQNKLGLCTKFKAQLTLKQGAKPVFRPKRPVAYAMQPAVKAELHRLVGIGVLTPITHSEWAAPMVAVRKASGKIRICGDFSTGLNDALEQHQHPLPIPEDVLSQLAGANTYSHIDLSEAFYQIAVDEHAQQLLVINTILGLLSFTRLPPGVKPAPTIFQYIGDKLIAGLSGVTGYIDDFFISGKTKAEHDRNLLKFFERVEEFGFCINLEKCNFALPEIEYLGYVINHNGISPSPRRIEAISLMPAPTNIMELRSFLGAVSFYGRFIKNMRDLREPLDELLKKGAKWNWNSDCQKSFLAFKNILSSDIVSTHYNPHLDIIVAADASMYGLGACILHKMPDGTLRPISHASRSLQTAEKSYSQIEKEAFAIIFAVKKFHKMIYGRKFILQTDHKHLLAIFGSKKGIPVHSANRLQRWAITLLAYNFNIEYVGTNSFGYADVLSRLIAQTKCGMEEDQVIASITLEAEINHVINSNLNALPITHRMLCYEIKKYVILKQVLEYIDNSWTTFKPTNNPELHLLYQRREGLSLANGCIMFGERLVIPKVLRKRIINQLHKAHQGIERMKQVARSYDKDIAEFLT